MELKNRCKLLLDNGTKKVKCHIFLHKELNRELALHEDIDTRGTSSISDVKTGLRMCSRNVNISKITLTQVDEMVYNFIKRFTLEKINEEFERLDKGGTIN